MNTLRAALVPGLIAGLISIFTSWFWMGFAFHSYQRATPETWRPEVSAQLHPFQFCSGLLSVIAIAALYVLIALISVGFFSEGIVGALRFAAAIWIALLAPVIVETAIYVRLPLDGCAWSSARLVSNPTILACGVTAYWWITR